MMNKTTSVLVLVSLSLMLVQCKKNKGAVSTASSAPAAALQTKAPKNNRVIIDRAYIWPGTTDAFELLSVRVEGDSLKAEVQYGGGCKEHDFSLHTNLLWMKSLPPQLNLYLEHKNNDDNCRALITTTLSYAIEDLRYEGINQVKLIVNGDREKMITYIY